MAFWWLEINPVNDNRDMELNETLVRKLHDKFCAIKKSRVFTGTYHTNYKEELVENCCRVRLGIGKSPYIRKEE